MEYEVKDRQSLLDVACIVYGEVNMAFEMALANNIALDEILTAGMVLTHQGSTRAISPATHLPTDRFPGGIDFMGIEIDFIII